MSKVYGIKKKNKNASINAQNLNTLMKKLNKTAGYEVAVAFADDTSKDGAWGAFAVRLQGAGIS